MVFRSRFLIGFILGFLVLGVAAAQGIDNKRLLDDLKTLSDDSMEGRRSGTPGAARARAYIIDRLKEEGLSPFRGSFTQPVRLPGRLMGANIIAEVRGTKDPDLYLVVSAHYDHVGVRNGEIYNGADDNASGAALLLSIAGYFQRHQPEHSIIFVFPDAEEMGFYGVTTFAESSVMDSVAMNVNLDMVGRSDKNRLIASGTYYCPYLRDVLDVVKPEGIHIKYGFDRPDGPDEDWTAQSDQVAFWEKGIPHVYFGVEDHADYHRPTDDFEGIDKDFYLSVSDYVLRVCRQADRDLARIRQVRGTRKCPVTAR